MDLDKIVALASMFLLLAFAIPYTMSAINTNSSLAGDLEPAILPAILLVMVGATLVIIVYVVSKHK